MPNADVICEILGYKYRYFADVETPRSLYIITALLLQFGLIKLDEIYKWVSFIYLSFCWFHQIPYLEERIFSNNHFVQQKYYFNLAESEWS